MSIEKKTLTVSIDTLFRAHYRELCLFGFRIVEDMDEVEDIVQNVFLHLITHKVAFENIQNPRAYLYTTVRNACLKEIKGLNSKLSIDNHLNSSAAINESIEESMIEMEKTIQIYQAIDSLPEQCRKIFVHCQIDRLKYQETAEELNISINSVKTQMKKAYRLLRDALKNVYSLSLFLGILGISTL